MGDELRSNKYTIALSDTDAEKVEALAKKDRRKVREYIYLIVSDYLAKQSR